MCDADKEHMLLLELHHAVFDAWSLQRIIGDVVELYGIAAAANVSPDADPSTSPAARDLEQSSAKCARFAAHARAENSALAAALHSTADAPHNAAREDAHDDAALRVANLRRALRYYNRELRGLPMIRSWRLHRQEVAPRGSIVRCRCDFVSRTIGRATTTAIKSFAKARGATPFAALLGAFQLVVSHWTDFHPSDVHTLATGAKGGGSVVDSAAMGGEGSGEDSGEEGVFEDEGDEDGSDTASQYSRYSRRSGRSVSSVHSLGSSLGGGTGGEGVARDDVLVYSAFLTRDDPEVADLAGPLLNIVGIRGRLTDDPTTDTHVSLPAAAAHPAPTCVCSLALAAATVTLAATLTCLLPHLSATSSTAPPPRCTARSCTVRCLSRRRYTSRHYSRAAVSTAAATRRTFSSSSSPTLARVQAVPGR